MVRNTVKHHATRANRDVITNSNIAKQDDIRPQLNAVTNHRTSQAVRAAIANGDAVANGKIVAGDDMFVNHYRVTMMDSEPPTNGRGGLDFIPEQAFLITRYSTSTGAAHRLFSTFFLRQTEQK